MKQKLIVFVLALFVLAVLAVGSVQAAAQDKEAKAGKEVTATGCLSKGATENQFELAAENGRTWDLTSDSNVNLADHVGHKVKVTGTRVEAQGQQGGAPGNAPGNQPNTSSAREEVRVSKIQHISDTCH